MTYLHYIPDKQHLSHYTMKVQHTEGIMKQEERELASDQEGWHVVLYECGQQGLEDVQDVPPVGTQLGCARACTAHHKSALGRPCFALRSFTTRQGWSGAEPNVCICSGAHAWDMCVSKDQAPCVLMALANFSTAAEVRS